MVVFFQNYCQSSMKLLVSILIIRPEKSWISGCGNGRHLVALQQLEFDVVGFDISLTGLALSREWLLEENLEVKLVAGDGRQKLPFRSFSFDGLISTRVIHHALISEIRLTISERSGECYPIKD